MRIKVMDTETSGLDPSEGASLLEIAWITLDDHACDWNIFDRCSHYVRYDGVINPEVKAIHHIVERDVGPNSSAVNRENIISSLLAAEEPGEMMYAFHNKAFDLKFLPELTLPTICTWRCAMHLFPDAPSHSNQVLRYWLGVEPPPDTLGTYADSGYHGDPVWVPLAPHRAAYDAEVTAAVLLRMLKTNTPQQLLTLTERPVLLRTCRFGKYRGTPWAEVPKDYLKWLNKNSDIVRDDADLRYTVRHHLGLES